MTTALQCLKGHKSVGLLCSLSVIVLIVLIVPIVLIVLIVLIVINVINDYNLCLCLCNVSSSL